MMSNDKIMEGFSRSEVVRVDSPAFLVSSAHRACRYETRAGEKMGPGHFLVLWPARADQFLYGRELRYFGPFATQDVARVLEASVMALGIVAPHVTGPASTGPSRHRLRQRTRPAHAAELGGLPACAELSGRPAAADHDPRTGC
jgi:hypothetical protein